MRSLVSTFAVLGLLAIAGTSPLQAQQPLTSAQVSNPLDVAACISTDLSTIDKDKAAIEAAEAGNNKSAAMDAYHKLHEDIAQLRYDRGICPPSVKADR